MTLARVPAGVPCPRSVSIAVTPGLAAFTGMNRAGSLGLFGLFAQLVDGGQVTFAHTVDETLERHIGDTYQAEVAVFTVQQTTGYRLVQVLEPMHANN